MVHDTGRFRPRRTQRRGHRGHRPNSGRREFRSAVALRTARRRGARSPRAHRMAGQPTRDGRVGSRRRGSAPVLEARSTEG